MFCEKCGKAVEPGEKFCYNCGAALTVEPVQTQQQSPATSTQMAYSNQTYAPVTVQDNTKKAPIYDIIIYIAAVFMVLGTLLPTVTVSIVNMSVNIFSFQGQALITLMGIVMLAAGVGVFVLYALNYDKYIFIAGIVQATLLLIFTIYFNSAIDKIFDLMGSGMGGYGGYGMSSMMGMARNLIGYGMGYFMMWIGSIIAIAFPFVAPRLEPYIGTRKIYIKK